MNDENHQFNSNVPKTIQSCFNAKRKESEIILMELKVWQICLT